MNKLAKLGITALCVILFSVSLSSCGGKKKNAPETVPETETTAEKESYDLIGSWYSDRENGDTLTLNKDGSYTSSVWLKDGNYSIAGNTLTLTDLFGKETNLTIQGNGEELTLVYPDPSTGHTYYQTEEALNAVKAARESAAEEEQSFNEAVVKKILTTGDWTNPNGYTLHMTNRDFTISKNEDYPNFGNPESSDLDTESTSKTYQYEITNIKAESHGFGYIFYSTIIKDDGEIQENVYFKISFGENNTYTINSEGFFYAYQFTKTIKIDFDTPPVSVPEETSVPETAHEIPTISHIDPETDSSKERVIVHEDGSVEHIRQIRRNDNPDLSSLWEDKVKRTNETVIGSSWRGTFDDTPIENTVYWTFDLNADNTYSRFNGETGVSETGTYTISYEETGTAYYGIFHLTNTEDVQTDLPFYLSTSQITQEPQLNLEMEPTYFLQK